MLLSCSCGWSRQITRHQNALARAAKVRAAKDEHWRAVRNEKQLLERYPAVTS